MLVPPAPSREPRMISSFVSNLTNHIHEIWSALLVTLTSVVTRAAICAAVRLADTATKSGAPAGSPAAAANAAAVAALAGRQAGMAPGRPAAGGSNFKTPAGSGLPPTYGMSPSTSHGGLSEAGQQKRLKVRVQIYGSG